MRARLIPAFLLGLLFSAGASAQIYVYLDDSNPALGTANSFPFGQVNGYAAINYYPASKLHEAGVPPFSLLTDIAVAPSSTGTYNAPQAQALVGHLSDPTPLPGSWTATLDNPAIIHDPAFGPYTFPFTTSTWTSLPGVAGAGFTWDGVRDIGFYYTASAGVTGSFSARRTGVYPRCTHAVFQPTNQVPSVASLTATKLRLTFAGTPVQQNTPQATLTMNGIAGAVTYDGGDSFAFNVSSTSAPLNPFYLLMSTGLAGGHYPLTGQSIDVGFLPFGFTDVFVVSPTSIVPALSGAGSAFDFLGAAGTYAFSFPLPCGVAIPRNYLQALIFDPTHPNNIRATGISSFELKQSCRYPFFGTFPAAIPDTNTPVSFSVNVPAGTIIQDVDLVLDLSHTAYTDFTITLTQNGTTSVSLKDATTVDSSDLTGRYRFSDEGIATFDQAALVSGNLVFNGRYSGDNPLSIFDGQDAGGVWTVTISDAVAGAAGSVLGAALIINGNE